MDISNLNQLQPGSILDADLVIIGGGPAGLSIAREFFGAPISVLVLESGQLQESQEFASLNRVDIDEGFWSPAQAEKRIAFHGENSQTWSHEVQGYGVRCRTLGGSTAAWAGKSASFDEIDFAARSWAPNSGWPITRASLDSYLDRAAQFLNLGPNCYDEKLWDLIGGRPPGPHADPAVLRSFFWQFARSRIDQMDLLRVGPEFVRESAPNVRVLLNATATQILTSDDGQRFEGLEVAGIGGARISVRAKAAVLAASAIENPRLLLASQKNQTRGIGNQHDNVGRFLMDHVGARIACFRPEDVRLIAEKFGFYGVRHDNRVFMYMHGLAPSPAIQERERMLNCALYMMEQRAPDDPWEALKRLARRKSENMLSDVVAVASSPGLLAKGLGRRAFQSSILPERAKSLIVNQLIRFNPNFVAQEFQTGGLPHKLTGVTVDAITEQPAEASNRVTLSGKTDALGSALPHVHWRIGDDVRRTLTRLGHLLAEEFPRAGLSMPVLEDWVAQDRRGDAVIIDMAHTAGTTRMSSDPKRGVVDPECQVHGVAGLYVAGASVFPTSGHANPTLMIVALAIRLADRLKRDLSRPG